MAGRGLLRRNAPRALARSSLVICCGFLILSLVAIPATTAGANPANSGQVVAIGRSTIQLIDIPSGWTKDVLRSDGYNPICLANGKGIAFVRTATYGPGSAQEIFVLYPHQKTAAQVTFDMDARGPTSASADGEQLAYVSYKTNQLYVVRIDTRVSTQLTTTLTRKRNNGASPSAFAPVWSPDGKRLAFAYSDNVSRGEFFRVLDIDTGRLVTIHVPLARLPIAWSPWSPDGTRLALGGLWLRIVDVSADEPSIVREFRGNDDPPGEILDVNWSPDGTKLAFTQSPHGGTCDRIYVMDIESGVSRKVSSSFFEYRCFGAPRWSPGSDLLAFIGRSSRGDMSLLPWPPNIFGELHVADTDLSVKRVTGDLDEPNMEGVSWCATPMGFGE
jgi:Tol biopolymer transport system component